MRPDEADALISSGMVTSHEEFDQAAVDLANVDMETGAPSRILDDDRASRYPDDMATVEIPDFPRLTTPQRRAKLKREGRTTRGIVETSLSGLGDVFASDHPHTGTLHGLAVVTAILDEMTQTEVQQQREYGASWADIGAALGMSKQAAWQKYGTVKES